MALTILNLGDLKGGGGQRHAPVTLTPGKEPSFHSRGGWVGLGAGMIWSTKSRPTVFETLDIQPIQSRYNDFAILAASVQVQDTESILVPIGSEFHQLYF